MADTRAKPGAGRGRVWHPVSLPEGYHALPRGQAWQNSADGREGMLPPGQRVVRLRQADGMPHNTQRARSTLGLSLGRETSGSSEKPGEVARAVLLLKPTDPPVGAWWRYAERTSWPISRILDDRTILTPKCSELSSHDRLDTLWSQNPSR
jgi:hypothetical protein